MPNRSHYMGKGYRALTAVLPTLRLHQRRLDQNKGLNMRDKNRPIFVCFDCRSDVYGSVRAVPRRLLCNECLAVSHTLLCAECLWIRTLMPNPAERASMRADEVLTRAAFAALAAAA
jgi:hypothetical protein